jgi:hypothetical protein
MRQPWDRVIVPDHRVGVSDQADFANEEFNMSPQTTPASLPVGHLGFGAMRITGQGIWGPPRDESEAIALLRRVVDKGVTFIDTADSYGPGISESLIAKALFPYPTGLVVATKGGLTRPVPIVGSSIVMRCSCRQQRKSPRRSVLWIRRLSAIPVTGPHLPGPRSVMLGCFMTAGARIGKRTV